MAEWIGHLIANWPIWAIIIALIFVSVVWVVYYLGANADYLWSKKGWWQDHSLRLKNESIKGSTKMKAKKG